MLSATGQNNTLHAVDKVSVYFILPDGFLDKVYLVIRFQINQYQFHGSSCPYSFSGIHRIHIPLKHTFSFPFSCDATTQRLVSYNIVDRLTVMCMSLLNKSGMGSTNIIDSPGTLFI